MVKTENMITVEYRCEHCGKLLLKKFKKGVDISNTKCVIIVVRCTRCSADNTISL